MTNRYSKCSLQVDDYLDLLNLAQRLGDEKWQKEIKRKLRHLECRIQIEQNA
ncbi:hypothetical protein [Paenibacillus physcomitrellae]|uniref:Sporulation histidine kinase inhibitor Sda n=1 Tax=Paenibacillus physcomitrellae TaxID=1619311 RepID=A0ABQ1FV93_9BACL|nr:hypothetical protein [Paenibacillus physcomitrellae]GGA30844.1 hypothetical protein GCM10010917_14870 [Paenibacillus physcomitrellae]